MDRSWDNKRAKASVIDLNPWPQDVKKSNNEYNNYYRIKQVYFAT
jgi:hypothetical protein